MKGIDFYKYNKIFGLSVGIFSFIIYSLTVEPTASYWDCAEYISTSAKLQIGHPPGAPLFQMLGAIFSIFALESKDRQKGGPNAPPDGLYLVNVTY